MLQKVAQGGLCEIFLAEETAGPSRGRRCVLKLLRASYLDDPHLLGAMKNEAQILSRLRHPNIVQFYGPAHIGELEGLALEVLEGCTVGALSRLYDGRPTWSESLAIMVQVFEALDYVHRVKGPDGRPLDIVHRDIAPSNVFLTSDGRVKLLDFGVSRWTRSVHKTKQGVLKGTPSFMSPEQARGDEITSRSDLFSGGLVLLGLLNGSESPFRRGSLGATLIAVSEGLRPKVSELLPRAPGRLVDLLERLLERWPEARPARAHEVATELKAVMAELGERVGRVGLQDVCARARYAAPTSESARSAATEPGPAPVLESDSLARIFESIQGRITDLTPTARRLGPPASSGDVTAPGAAPTPEGPVEPDFDARVTEGFVPPHARRRPEGEAEANTVVMPEPLPGETPGLGFDIARTVTPAVPMTAPASRAPIEAPPPDRGPRRGWLAPLLVGLVLGGLALRGPDSDALDRSSPRTASPALEAPAPPSREAAVDGAAAAPSKATRAPKARAFERRRPSRAARRASRRAAATAPAAPAPPEPAVGALSVRCPAPWRLRIEGVSEMSSEGEGSTELEPGTYRVVLSSGSRRYSATAVVVAGSPAVIECPWGAPGAPDQ